MTLTFPFLKTVASTRCAIPKSKAEYLHVQGETKERWQKLCEQAATEQDPTRLVALMQEINRLLEEKEKRLRQPTRADGKAR